jgi:peptidyl-prolyl cis-trans isomerase B (cyclophilin B)
MPAPAATSDTPPVTISTPPAPAPDDAGVEQQVVVLDTSMGRIVIELDPDAAPRTCENFVKLVSNGFYNHTAFHRVIPNFIIQGGDPNSKSNDRSTYGKGDPGYTLPAEIKLKHDLGAVAMARLPDSVNPQRDSNGSQFYICVAPCPSLDDNYTVFGHVIKGLDIVANIANQPRDPHDNPLSRIEMQASLEPKDKALADAPPAQ